MAKRLKIFVYGREGANWSIDKDRKYLEITLKQEGYDLTSNFFAADIVYSVWWNKLLDKKHRLIRKIFSRKKVIATITNDLQHQQTEIKRLIPLVDLFVHFNSKQKSQLIAAGVNPEKTETTPLFVDHESFYHLNKPKEWICEQLKIDFKVLQNKVLIGSFQRDSLGSDLLAAKWQKNPALLLEIMEKLDERFILVLAGPRRHFLYHECLKRNIPFVFVGNTENLEAKLDDLSINNLAYEKVNLLYNLVDFYIVTSSSEGGPKAILEASLCKTPLLSTNVGIAEDVLSKFSLYNTANQCGEKINFLLNNTEENKNVIEENFKRAHAVTTKEYFGRCVRNIIDKVEAK